MLLLVDIANCGEKLQNSINMIVNYNVLVAVSRQLATKCLNQKHDSRIVRKPMLFKWEALSKCPNTTLSPPLKPHIYLFKLIITYVRKCFYECELHMHVMEWVKIHWPSGRCLLCLTYLSVMFEACLVSRVTRVAQMLKIYYSNNGQWPMQSI